MRRIRAQKGGNTSHSESSATEGNPKRNYLEFTWTGQHESDMDLVGILASRGQLTEVVSKHHSFQRSGLLGFHSFQTSW